MKAIPQPLKSPVEPLGLYMQAPGDWGFSSFDDPRNVRVLNLETLTGDRRFARISGRGANRHVVLTGGWRSAGVLYEISEIETFDDETLNSLASLGGMPWFPCGCLLGEGAVINPGDVDGISLGRDCRHWTSGRAAAQLAAISTYIGADASLWLHKCRRHLVAVIRCNAKPSVDGTVRVAVSV